jgi:DNA polymerase III epsilon subunit-like protein
MTYLIFDTETTGLPKNWKAPVLDLNNWPRLVQISWMQCDNSGKILSSSNYIVKPQDFIIPEDAVKIHGITNEKAKNEGVALNIVLKEFSTAIIRSSILIAHNMNFDAKVVGAEFLREKIVSGLFTIPKICTMEKSTDYCKIPNSYGYKWPSLSELYFKLFEKDIEGAHDAVADVRACAECFFRLKQEGILK